MASETESTLASLHDQSSDEPSFREAYPEYSKTWRLDILRFKQYAYLDTDSHIYVDYTGAGLAAEAQFAAHTHRLSECVFGNPHSANPTSLSSTEQIEKTRARVLRYFNADPAEYVAIFTANATAAARLVGEAYPFMRGSRLVLTSDNHNSIVGIREFARRCRAKTVYIPMAGRDLRIATDNVIQVLKGQSAGPFSMAKSLFAYPAQSNFSGVRHSLRWVSLAQSLGYHVLLDAAAFVPTAMLDLSIIKADFVTVSWYKVLGFPTGIGCLIARKEALLELRRPWFSGGTVRAVTVGVPWHAMGNDEASFEDGTLNYLSIPDVSVGLDWIEDVGIDIIATRVRCLTGWLLRHLLTLYHSNDRPMIRLYGPSNLEDRGGTVSFNILDETGRVVDERLVTMESARANISLCTGCFCNPGAGEQAFGVKKRSIQAQTTNKGRWRRKSQRRQGREFNFEEFIGGLKLPSAGAIRISFGIASLPRDVDACIRFIVDTYRDRRTDSAHLEPREGC